MNLNTANLKVVAAASSDPTRRAIMSIHVTSKHTEATNGHILARVTLPRQFEVDDIPSSCPTDKAENVTPFSIPATAVKGLKTYKHKTLPLLNDTLYVDVEKTNNNGTAHFTATDLEQTSAPAITKIDAEFPDVDRVIPTQTPEWQSGFNISYLETLLVIAKNLGTETVTVSGYSNNSRLNCLQEVSDWIANNGQISGNDISQEAMLERISKVLNRSCIENGKPWMLEAENHDTGQKFLGIIMPIRL